MLRFEFSDLQFNRHKAGQRTVVEQKINVKVLSAHLNAVFLADKREVLSKFKNELLQIACDRLAKVTLGILLRQIKKFKHIGIKDAASHILRYRFGYQLLGGKHITLIVSTVHLAFQFTLGIMFLCAQCHVEMPFFRRL